MIYNTISDIEDKQKKTHYVAKEKYVFQLNFKPKRHICQFMKHYYIRARGHTCIIILFVNKQIMYLFIFYIKMKM